MRELILYGVIGITSALVDFTIFVLMSKVFPHYLILDTFVGMLVGMLISFLLNTFFNFKKWDYLWKRFVTFMSIGLSGIVLSLIIMTIGVKWLLFNRYIVKLVSIIIVAIYQFILNKYITYKDHS